MRPIRTATVSKLELPSVSCSCYFGSFRGSAVTLLEKEIDEIRRNETNEVPSQIRV